MKLSALLLSILAAAGTVQTRAQTPTTFDDCDAQVLRHPDDDGVYDCHVTIAARQNGWNEAARRLEARLLVNPANHLAKLALASVQARLDGKRAEQLYIESIDAFIEQKATGREVTARLEFAAFLAVRSRIAESAEQLELAGTAAERSGESLLPAWIEVHRARVDYHQARYEAAETRLLAIEEVLFRDGNVIQKSMWYSMAGSVYWGMARYEEALQAFRKQAELLHSIGNPYEEAVALSNVALLTTYLDPPSARRHEPGSWAW